MSTTHPHGKRLIALFLSGIMAFGPVLSGCTQQAAPTDAADDAGKSEMDTSANDVSSINVDYNAQGNYTVTIKESDLMKLEASSADDEGKAVGDETEMTEEKKDASDGAPAEASNAGQNEVSLQGDAATTETTAQGSTTEELDKKYAAEGKEGYTYKGLSGDQPQWEPIEYTVMYGGELAKPIEDAKATYETELTLPEPDAREGYTFVGWATAETKPADGETSEPPYLVFPAKTVFKKDLACAFDVDGNGTIDENEQAKLAKYATEANEIKLYAQWDGAPNNGASDADASGSVAPATTNPGDAATVKFSDIKQDDVVVAYAFAPITEQGGDESEAEMRSAQVTEFKNENGAITVSFADPDAAANDTDAYYVYLNGLDSVAVVEVSFKEYALTSETKSVSCESDNNTITLKVDGDEFAEGISANDIVLGGSFKEMQVAEVSPSGSSLTLKLTGLPVIEQGASTTYTAGQITVAEGGFKDGTRTETAYVDVDLPTASFDVEGIKTSGGSVTIPLYVTGIDPNDVSAGDITFASGAKVTDVKADGDKLQVTVATDNVSDLAGQVKVKDQEYLSPVTHAIFDADLNYVEGKDDKLEITLLLAAEDGKFSRDLSADKVSLADGFADGTVTSVETQDDTNAKLVISVPANGKTAENYDFVGTVTLAEGAMEDDWGGAAPEYSYATYYAASEGGKDAESDKDAAAKLKEEKRQKKQDKVDRAQKVVDYGVEALNFVGGDAAVVGAYCLDIFKIASSAYMGDIGGVASGIGNIIKRAGLLEGGEDPNLPSSQTVEEKMDELKSLMSTMDQRMDAIENNQYDMLVRAFDNALDALASDCSRAESMLRGAKEIYVQQGKTVPAEDASQEELLAYNHALIDIIEKEEKNGNRAFKNYSSLVARIENNYITVTTEAKKDWNRNPFQYYDKRVSGYFNWETQGWYMRETYRSYAKFQITRAYSTLSLYYEIPQNAERFKDITERFAKSLQTIEDHPAGLSPTDWKGGMEVYSSTLKRSVTEFSVGDTNKDSHYVGDNEVNAYKARLHDKSIQDDLALAFPEAKETFSSVGDTGIGMGGKWGKSKVRLRGNDAFFEGLFRRLIVTGDKSSSAKSPIKLGKENIYFERILYWNGDFKSIKTQDKGEKISIKFLIME